jgi:uncharacterized membrane protein
MVSAAKRAGQAWVKFWFGADYAMPARLFQVLVPLLLACFIFTRTPDLRIFYTPDGLGALGIRDFEELRHRPSIFYVLGSYGWIQFGHWLLIGSLLAMVLGFFPRVASVVTVVVVLRDETVVTRHLENSWCWLHGNIGRRLAATTIVGWHASDRLSIFDLQLNIFVWKLVGKRELAFLHDRNGRH